MFKPFITLGDTTTHKGQVICASSTLFINGKPVALVGDQVQCPKSGHGVNKIIEGCSDWFEGDRALVVEGCRTECGCQLIASQSDGGVD